MQGEIESVAAYRSHIDREINQLEINSDQTIPTRLKALHLALRMQANTLHQDVSQTTYIPMFTLDGVGFPDPASFGKVIWLEIKSAALEEKRPRPAAQLADLVWIFQHDPQFGLMALDRYVESYETIDIQSANSQLKIDFLISIYRSLELSKQMSKPPIHDRVVTAILTKMEELTATFGFKLNGFLLDLFRMARLRFRHFSHAEKIRILEYAKRLSKRGQVDEYLTLNALELTRDIARSLNMGNEVLSAQEEIVSHYLNDSIASETSGLSISERLRNAIVEISALPRGHKMKCLIPELERMRQALLSDKSQYSSFTYEFDIHPEMIDEFLDCVQIPQGYECLAPSLFLISHIPNRERAMQTLRDHKLESPFFHMISHLPIWGDGVIESSLETEEKKDHYFMTQNISMNARMITPYLLLLQEREEMKFDMESVTRVICESKLLDQRRQEIITAGVAAHFDGRYRLAVSIIALEFEPTVRHIMTIIGSNYLVSDENGAQHTMQLYEMLHDSKVESVLGESWVVLAESILLSEGGPKVRHRVAHGRDISDVATMDFSALIVSMFLFLCNLTTPHASETQDNEL